MKAWMDWAQRCGDKLVDMGSPLGNGITLGPGGKSTASDSRLLGYSILQAGNMEEARDLMKDHPHLDWNAACEIEIHECLPVPGN